MAGLHSPRVTGLHIFACDCRAAGGPGSQNRWKDRQQTRGDPQRRTTLRLRLFRSAGSVGGVTATRGRRSTSEGTPSQHVADAFGARRGFSARHRGNAPTCGAMRRITRFCPRPTRSSSRPGDQTIKHISHEEDFMSDDKSGPAEGIKGVVEGAKGLAKEAGGSVVGHEDLEKEG